MQYSLCFMCFAATMFPKFSTPKVRGILFILCGIEGIIPITHAGYACA